MNNQTNYITDKEPEHLVPGYNAGQFIRWFGVSMIVVGVLIYLAYYFGSNENQRKINRLNSQIQYLGEVESLDTLITELKNTNDDLTLSSRERRRLTELLDQLITHKSDLQIAQQELTTTKNQLIGLENKYQDQLTQLQQQNTELSQQVAEMELAMSYRKNAVQMFELNVNDSHLLLDDHTSRFSLHSILSNGSAQLYVGNALMFFHIGHTLRFRFQPNWLCDITMTRIDQEKQKIDFEYSCKLN